MFETLLQGTISSGSNQGKTKIKIFNRVYVGFTAPATLTDLKDVKINVSIRGEREIKIIDADLFSLGLFTDVKGGVGEDSALYQMSIPVGHYELFPNEEVYIDVYSDMTINNFLAVARDIEFGAPVKIQSYQGINDEHFKDVLEAHWITPSGQITVNSKATTSEVAKLFTSGDYLESPLDIGELFVDPNMTPQSLDISGSNEHLLLVQSQNIFWG